MVDLDRGTMPIARSDFLQTSFERKMRAYLTAHAGKQHEKHFGWKTFRRYTWHQCAMICHVRQYYNVIYMATFLQEKAP